MLERVASGSRILNLALVLTELSEALLLVGRVDEASACRPQSKPGGFCRTGPRVRRMSHFVVSGRVDELTDGTVGSVDAAMGPQSVHIGNPG